MYLLSLCAAAARRAADRTGDETGDGMNTFIILTLVFGAVCATAAIVTIAGKVCGLFGKRAEARPRGDIDE